jgi:hypothetical protein
MELIEELGSDQTLNILQKAADKQAEVFARNLDPVNLQDLDPLASGEKIYRRFMSDTGAEIDFFNRNGDSVTFRVNKCPFYLALLDVGIDCGYFLEGLCRNLTIPLIQKIMNKFDTRLNLEVKVIRQSIEDFCLEKISLAVD